MFDIVVPAEGSRVRYDQVFGKRQRNPTMAPDKPDDEEILSFQSYAKYIAMVVRNAMEDFHCKHLSDEQMKELNPIIRNAVYTAIYGFMTSSRSEKSKRYVDHVFQMIPPYWEDPELLVSFDE